MYGLKQAHLAWHTELCGGLLSIGFKEFASAPCVFRRKFKSEYAFILVYVDDIPVLAVTLIERELVVEEHKCLYDFRVLEAVEMFLGVQLRWTLSSAVINVSLMLTLETDKYAVLVEGFQKVIGSLLYLALRTRLDILDPVLILARLQKSPTVYYHRSSKRVLRYLRGTTKFGLPYHSGSTVIQEYVDV